jgi:hypothetical protein
MALEQLRALLGRQWEVKVAPRSAARAPAEWPGRNRMQAPEPAAEAAVLGPTPPAGREQERAERVTATREQERAERVTAAREQERAERLTGEAV